MRAEQPWIILMEAIISRMNCEISMLMGYYRSQSSTLVPNGFLLPSGLIGMFPRVGAGKEQYKMLHN